MHGKRFCLDSLDQERKKYMPRQTAAHSLYLSPPVLELTSQETVTHAVIISEQEQIRLPCLKRSLGFQL